MARSHQHQREASHSPRARNLPTQQLPYSIQYSAFILSTGRKKSSMQATALRSAKEESPFRSVPSPAQYDQAGSPKTPVKPASGVKKSTSLLFHIPSKRAMLEEMAPVVVNPP